MIYAEIKYFEIEVMVKPSPFHVLWIKHKQNDSFNWIELRKHVRGLTGGGTEIFLKTKCASSVRYTWTNEIRTEEKALQFDEVVVNLFVYETHTQDQWLLFAILFLKTAHTHTHRRLFASHTRHQA